MIIDPIMYIMGNHMVMFDAPYPAARGCDIGSLRLKHPDRPSAPSSFIENLADVSFLNRGERGMFVMLEFYFDDSGTHNSSRVVVWGGIAGYKDFVREMEASWQKLLACPCPDKPPISRFHSGHLYAGEGEFVGYSSGERDLTRYNFRKAIVDAGLSWVSHGASVTDWNDIITGKVRQQLGSAERYTFGRAILQGCKAAIAEDLPVSFQFDLGRKFPDLDSIIHPAIEVSGIAPRQVSYGYSSVQGNFALQAADLVAHETYQHFTKFLNDQDAPRAAHLDRLVEDAFDVRGDLMTRSTIEELAREMLPTFKQIDPTWGS